jgi:hypothetical protein
VIISCNGANVSVVLNGTRSSGPDGNRLQYVWYEAGAPLASGVVAVVPLAVGVHPILLVVNDGMLSATNAVTIRVITGAQAVQELIAQVAASWPRSKPLLATLSAAVASLERGSCTPALNQLSAFQHKVRAQVEPSAPALARNFVQAAQGIVHALDCCQTGRSGRSVGPVTPVVRHPDGRTALRFSAEPGLVYILEASTNLVHWEMIAVAVDQGDGTFLCEDANTAKAPKCFYRIRAQ